MNCPNCSQEMTRVGGFWACGNCGVTQPLEVDPTQTQFGFSFEDIVTLTERNILLILRDVETADLSLALKGAAPEVKDKIFANLSEKAAVLIREEMDYMGAVVSKKDVEDAQSRIVNLIMKLEEKGEIGLESRILSDQEIDALLSVTEEDPEVINPAKESKPGRETDETIAKGMKIAHLYDRSIQLVLRQVEMSDLCLALVGAAPEEKERVFANMGNRAAQMLQEDIEYMGAVSEGDVEFARERINSIIGRLIEAGEIVELGEEVIEDRSIPEDEEKPIKIDVDDHESLRQGLVRLAEKARREGILSLEAEGAALDDDFLKKGLQLIIDGCDPDLLESILTTEIDSYEGYSKLRVREMVLEMEKELVYILKTKAMILEGISSLQWGDNPLITNERLIPYHPQSWSEKESEVAKVEGDYHLSLRESLVRMAEKGRREGLLSLENDANEVDDDFLKKGLLMVIDGGDPEMIKDILGSEIAFYGKDGKMKIEEETLGMEKDLAHDLKTKEMILAGVLLIQSGDNPGIVDVKLAAFNPEL